MLDKKSLSERDICTKFITPAIVKAGWDFTTQFLEEVYFTDGKIYVRGKLHSRGKANRTFRLPLSKPKTTNTPSARDYSKR
jgi:type I restriction enzyme R subunit